MALNVLLVMAKRLALTAFADSLYELRCPRGSQRLRKGQLDCFMDITDEGLKLASFSPHDRESEA